MELAPAGVPLSFEVTFDEDDLFVAMSVYDDTGLTPTLVSGPSAMSLVADNTYRAKFTATQDRSYIIIKAVYTDGSFTVLSPNYSQGSESIVAQVIGGGGSSSPTGGTLIGLIEADPVIVGIVTSDPIVGLINC